MRLRRKAWARPELAACQFYVDNPAANYGHWRRGFCDAEKPVVVELGCGKGAFIAELAAADAASNYIGVDIKSEVLALAKRNAERAFAQAGREEIDNFLLAALDIERIDMAFSSADTVDALFIQFPNPWPKDAHQKKRLTHTRQLLKYKIFLRPGARVYFKTDDYRLFLDSFGYFFDAGYLVEKSSRDAVRDTYLDSLPKSEHERMFLADGKLIYYIIAHTPK